MLQWITAHRWAALGKCDQGVTGVEYALIASLIAMAIVGEVTTLGNEVSDNFAATHAALDSANS